MDFSILLKYLKEFFKSFPQKTIKMSLQIYPNGHSKD